MADKAFYDMILEEQTTVKQAYEEGKSYQDCKVLAALYELPEYAAGKLAEAADEEDC